MKPFLSACKSTLCLLRSLAEARRQGLKSGTSKSVWEERREGADRTRGRDADSSNSLHREEEEEARAGDISDTNEAPLSEHVISVTR